MVKQCFAFKHVNFASVYDTSANLTANDETWQSSLYRWIENQKI